VLRVAGIIFPLAVMARALVAFHRRRRQQVFLFISSSYLLLNNFIYVLKKKILLGNVINIKSFPFSQ
jgi:hypothetical protein